MTVAKSQSLFCLDGFYTTGGTPLPFAIDLPEVSHSGRLNAESYKVPAGQLHSSYLTDRAYRSYCISAYNIASILAFFRVVFANSIGLEFRACPRCETVQRHPRSRTRFITLPSKVAPRIASAPKGNEGIAGGWQRTRFDDDTCQTRSTDREGHR